jgi:DNA-binding NtrC family response regulator
MFALKGQVVPPDGASMFRRVLFVDGVPPSVSKECITIPTILTEFAGWDSLADERLFMPDFDLLVAVAAPGCRASTDFFQSLSARPVNRPVLGIFSENDRNLHTSSRIVDDFILAPVRAHELRHRIHRILDDDTADSDERKAHMRLSREIAFASLVGEHPSFMRTLEQIPLVAHSACTVVITGETGTGKELCARAIHHLSPRGHQPFIPVDCAAFPEHLFENEMFGHARGAFTDAHRDQKGLVALASGGTLFLDEIDSLSIAAQSKLLRFIQERTYRPIGSTQMLRVDVRILVATNKNLETLVREGKFRSDLFFRLNVVRLHLVPLRERRSDVLLLAQHFLNASVENGAPRKVLSPAAAQKLMEHDWPGNIRELSNVIQRGVVFAPTRQIQASHIRNDAAIPDVESSPTPANFRDARARTVEAFERAFIEDALQQASGNVTRAAQLVQKDRRVFGRLMKRYNIRHDAL